MINIKQLLESNFCQEASSLDKLNLFVNDQKVWDYKVQNGELRLIHEPVEGSDKYDQVNLAELKKGLTLEEAECPVVSETLEKGVESVVGLRRAEGPVGLNFVI